MPFHLQFANSALTQLNSLYYYYSYDNDGDDDEDDDDWRLKDIDNNIIHNFAPEYV